MKTKTQFTKQLLSIFLCIAMLLTYVPLMAFAADGSCVKGDCTGSYSNGFCSVCDGYEEPELVGALYQITNAGQLYWFADRVNNGEVNVSGQLMNDIIVNENVLDAKGNPKSPSSLRMWTPIGKGAECNFYGNFYGNGYAIRGLYCVTSIAGSTINEAGLFGTSHGSVIQDILIEDSYFEGLSAGAIVGWAIDSYIRNCHSSATVKGHTIAGGIVANATVSTISNSGCTGRTIVSGDERGMLGGILGHCMLIKDTNFSQVMHCYYNGTLELEGINSLDNKGALVGGVKYTSVTDCYYLDTLGDAIGSTENIYDDSDGDSDYYYFDESTVLSKTRNEFASGAVCALMGFHPAIDSVWMDTDEACLLCPETHKPHVPVEKIDGEVLLNITPGKYTLPGGVLPTNASCKQIVWTVLSGPATVSGNVLEATAVGTIQLQATVKNGGEQRNDFSKTYTIECGQGQTFDIGVGDIVIEKYNDTQWKITYGWVITGTETFIQNADQPVWITGETQQYSITVKSGATPTIGLRDCNIMYQNGGLISALTIEPGAAVTLQLNGENSLVSSYGAGIAVPEGASLTITGNGSLLARATRTGNAAIGGTGENVNCGTITIYSGTVTAEGASFGAPIGGGKGNESGGNGGNITIHGGTVTAVARGYSAGIGGGDDGGAGKIAIHGGIVTVKNTDSTFEGSCIGAGHGGSGGSVEITGGIVTVTNLGTITGPGIGGENVTVTISGGTVSTEMNAAYYGDTDLQGMIVITGGNVKADTVTEPTDGKGNKVYLNTLTLISASADSVIAELDGADYGLKDVRPLDQNKLYIYLPENTKIANVIVDGEVIPDAEGDLIFCDHSFVWSLLMESTCVESGIEVYQCEHCGYHKEVYETILAPGPYPESDHPRKLNQDDTQRYFLPGAKKMTVTFSDETEVFHNFDFIYIYDANGKQVGRKYTGVELAGKTIEIIGNAFSVRIKSNQYLNYYGYSIDSIYAQVPMDADHVDRLPLAEHDYQDGICTVCGKAQHTHDWSYTASDGTITATCDATGCPEPNGGSVTLKVSDAYYTGGQLGAIAEGSFTNGATYIITYNDGSEAAPSAVGTYTAKLTVSENGSQKQSVTGDYTISYLLAPSPAYAINGHNYTDGDVYWFKSGMAITITAPAGYTVSTVLDGTYGNSVIFSESDRKVVYLKRTSDGAMTDAIEVSGIHFDGTGANGKITIEKRGFWEKLLNRISFGLFFKGDVVVTVTANDTESGVSAIQYYVAEKDLINDGDISALEAAVGGDWQNYNGEIGLTKNTKNVIYAKFTDNVGNISYISSDGIVLYSDSTSIVTKITTTYNIGEDKDIPINLNGNTVKSVLLDGVSLTAGSDYTVSSDAITLKAKCLDKLNVGSYILTVSFDPLGETYVETEGNDAPQKLMFNLEINKANIGDATVSVNGSFAYDGKTKTPDPVVVLNGVTLVKDQDYTVSYTDNMNAGQATVTVTGKDNYTGTKAAIFSIDPADIKDAVVTLDQNTFIYDGTAHKPKVMVTFNGATLQEGVDYRVTYLQAMKFTQGKPTKWFGNGETSVDCINANDNYYAVVEGMGNYYTADKFTLYAPFVIEKVTVTEPTIASKAYNGSTQTADITDTDLYTVAKNEGGTAKGNYNVVLKLKDADNYKWRTTDNMEVTLQFVISAAENTWTTTPTINGWAYGDNANVPTAAAKYGAVKVVYSGIANDGSDYNSETAPTKAGSYTATFTVEGTEDYSGLSKQVNFTIAKANYDMGGAKWNYAEAYKYDGKSHSVWVDESSLPNGVSVSRYTGNTASNVGEYTANVSLIYDYDNYNAPEFNCLLEWSIENNWTPIEYTVSGEGWLNKDFVINAADGYKVSLTNTAEGAWEDTIVGAEEGIDNGITFYLKNETDGTISLAKTVNYKLDKTAPTGKVELVNRTGWETFLNNISFNLFYKDEVTVKVTADDNLSGIKKIEYASSDGAMTLDEVKAITDWTEYTDSFGVTLEDAKKFVYFVRITDNAGNTAYLSTDGAEYDTTAPVTSGIENGKTYYTTQKVTIADKNLDTFTLNGNPVTGTIILDGNKDATYTIVSKDKAGNETTVTITMKPVSTVGSNIDDITEDNVTSSNKDTVQAVLDEVTELLTDEDLTDDEKAALEKIKSDAEKLIEKIDNVENATDTENTEKVENVTPENVTPENKIDLEKAKADLEKALEDNGGNYTEDEKKAIEDEIKRIDGALEVIGNVESVEELIDKLPDTIKKDDEAAIKAADDAYNALSDYEKSLVDASAKKALDDAKTALAELKKPADTNIPQTGDNSNVWLWFVFAFISGSLLIGIGILKKKEERAE